MSGLPRSGSTLLRSILNQNPNIHIDPVSPMVELFYYNDEYFKSSEQYLAYKKPESAYKLISGLIDSYYFDVQEPFIIDHCRAWVNNIERARTYITEDVKILCPVRDVTEVLTSFITLMHRNTKEPNFVDIELEKLGYPPTDDNRCEYLMGPDGIVYQALWAQYQAFLRGDDKKHLHMIEYNDLVSKPQETMDGIYRFYGIDSYQHDFDNIFNHHREDESQWKLEDMHHVRRKLGKQSKDPKEVLSPEILHKFSNLEYWKNPNHKFLK